jgi:hypothetical protein
MGPASCLEYSGLMTSILRFNVCTSSEQEPYNGTVAAFHGSGERRHFVTNGMDCGAFV